ncbi:MAG: HDOD domain-containing protein [Gammaproteobacteria bacterium]|jgi:HD-like signal output (HDOD) protein|nr:HDOD domain-containing protein [Gammaproteobacteria bacterium]
MPVDVPVLARHAGATPARKAPEPNADLFQFLQKLITDMYEDLELPGFPDVVMRLHRTLGDQNCAVREVVRLVSAEPTLSARLLHLANSAAFNPGERAISDLKSAITLLGFNLVRSTASTFAMRQLEQQEWLTPIRPQLNRIWKDSTGVAAIAYVGARRTDGMRPDEALASGLFHQMGSLYILTRAHKEGISLGDDGSWAATIADWHPTIARAILENWGMPATLAAAVETQDGLKDGNAAEMPLLSRLLAAAKLYQVVMNGGDDAAAARELLGPVRFGTTPFLDMIGPAAKDIEAVTRVISQ